MKAIPSSEIAEQLHKEEGASAVSKLFENTEEYSGQLQMDLTGGKVEKYYEQLQSQWVAVDPSVEQEDDKEPAALKMIAIRTYSLEKID